MLVFGGGSRAHLFNRCARRAKLGLKCWMHVEGFLANQTSMSGCQLRTSCPQPLNERTLSPSLATTRAEVSRRVIVTLLLDARSKSHLSASKLSCAAGLGTGARRSTWLKHGDGSLASVTSWGRVMGLLMGNAPLLRRHVRGRYTN